jgi:hypothetical protein
MRQLTLAAAALQADAIVEIEGKEPHWSESAQSMLRRERRISLVPAPLPNVDSHVFRPASKQTLNRQWKEARLRRVRSRVRCSSVSSA